MGGEALDGCNPHLADLLADGADDVPIFRKARYRRFFLE